MEKDEKEDRRHPDLKCPLPVSEIESIAEKTTVSRRLSTVREGGMKGCGGNRRTGTDSEWDIDRQNIAVMFLPLKRNDLSPGSSTQFPSLPSPTGSCP